CMSSNVAIWPSAYANNASSPNMPYAARLRLKASYAPGAFSSSCDASCQTMVATLVSQLKHYGIYNSDIGGSWLVSAEQTTYSAAAINAFLELRQQVHGADFEVVDESSLMTDIRSGEVNWSNAYVTPEGAQVIATDANGNKGYRGISLRGVVV